MIIIIGPDHTGKTTLAKRLDLPYFHFDQHSTYEDFLKPLVNLEHFDAVLDRHAVCEFPYSFVMNRKFKFTMKQWHNLMLLTLIQNPLFIIGEHKPTSLEYSEDQYMPYEKWDICLQLYKTFFSTHHIPFITYDYLLPLDIPSLLRLERNCRADMSWWVAMRKLGIGCIGSPHPKVLFVAERIGPNNMNNLPFETGPTGNMMSDMLSVTGTPLNKVAITNMVKAPRLDSRQPNQADMNFLEIEIDQLKPEKIVFMGNVAKAGIKVAIKLGVPYETMTHFGYYNHRKESIAPLIAQWRNIMEIIP